MSYCNVKNRGASVVVYKIPELNIRRSFAPGETKKISYEELEKLTYQPGGMAILTRFLQVQDAQALNSIGARVEPEYHMSEQDIINLIKFGSQDAFLDALDFAPNGVIDLIKKYSISLPMTDMNKKKALKNKFGFDLDAILRHIEEEKEDDTEAFTSNTERRVKVEEAPAGRRTTPKYNVVSKVVVEEENV